MIPTCKLRFVERRYYHVSELEYETVRILQQWWETEEDGGNPVTRSEWCPGEWRDVPLEKEQA